MPMLMAGGGRMSVLCIYLSANATIFSIFGAFAQIQSNIPLPILAAPGITPALGLGPRLTLQRRQPFAAIVLGALTVALIKLAACVVARIVYGLNYIALGHVSADWHTAKLMISLLWAATFLVSVHACHRHFVSMRAQ